MASFFIIGKSGTGKTRSLGTLPGSLFNAQFDPSGERAIRRKPVYFEAGDADDICESKELNQSNFAVIRYLSIAKTITKDYRLDSKQLSQKRMLDLFILDCNTILTQSSIDNVTVDPLTGLSRVAKGAIFSQAGTKGATYRDWDLFAEKILEICEVSQGYENKNFVLTAHIQTEKDAITESIFESPYADGQKVSRTIMQAFDVVYQSVFKDGKYLWRTKPTEMMQSIRNRLVDGDDLPDYIDQDFTQLLNKCREVK